jgi:IS605 OrfB family transposase
LPKPYEETRLLEFLEAGKRFLGLQSSLLHGLQEQAPFTPLPAEELDLGAKTVPLLQALFDAPDRETALHACEALNRRLLKIVRERYRGLRSRRGQGHVHAGRMYLIRQLISYECSYASRRFLGATGKIVVGQKRGLYQLPQIRNLRNKLTNLVLDRIQKAGGQFVRLAIQHRVHVVAMEDLAGWQRRTEQDKRMNRLLILWSHRRISEALERGLPREGILLCTAWPAWTSRIDAWGRPGLRCRPVEGWMQRRPEGSRIGDLIPWRKGGTVWASVQDNALVTYGSEEVAAISIGKALLRGPQESISSVEVFKIPDGSGFIVNLPHHLAGLEFDPHTGFQTKRHPTLLDELRKDSAETQKFFRDLSGDVISATVWLGVGEFWDSVEAHVTDVLRESWKQQTEIAAE